MILLKTIVFIVALVYSLSYGLKIVTKLMLIYKGESPKIIKNTSLNAGIAILAWAFLYYCSQVK